MTGNMETEQENREGSKRQTCNSQRIEDEGKVQTRGRRRQHPSDAKDI